MAAKHVRVTISLLLFFSALPSSVFAGTNVVGSVVGVTGTTIRGVPVLVGTTVFSGDTLEVGKGTAEVSLVGGGLTILGSQSEVTFEREPDPVTVRLGRGLVTFVSRAGETEGMRLAVGGITIEPAQGLATVAQVSLSGSEVIISTKEGSLEFERFGERVTLPKGKAIKISPATQAPSPSASNPECIGLGKLTECAALGAIPSVVPVVALQAISPSQPDWEWGLTPIGPVAGVLICMELPAKAAAPVKAPPESTTCTLEPDRDLVPFGDSVTLNWKIQGATSNSRLRAGIEELTKVNEAEGSFDHKPSYGTTIYELAGIGGNGKPFRCTAKVVTRECMIYANTDRVKNPGDEVTLTWQVASKDFKRADITDSSGKVIVDSSGKALANIKAQGSAAVKPTTRTVYTLRWESSKGIELPCTVTVYVGEPLTCTLEEDPSEADETTITLRWTSKNATTHLMQIRDKAVPPFYTTILGLQLKGDEGEAKVKGPTKDTEYRLVVGNATGETHECYVTVESGCRLNAQPCKVEAGGALKLRWRAPGNKREINPGVGEVPVQDTREVNPTQSTVYILTKTPAPSCKTCVTVEDSGKAGDGSRTLAIPPLYQHLPNWCWLAVSEMIFRYYKVKALNEANYQCGIIAVAFPAWCNANCLRCDIGGGNETNVRRVLMQYPIAAGAASVKSNHLTGSLTAQQIKTEIDAGRPVIAGISPTDPSVRLVPQHVALITGYVEDGDGQLHLIVNDPYPFDRVGFPNPYVMSGGQNNRDGSYCILLNSFTQRLKWTESFLSIRP